MYSLSHKSHINVGLIIVYTLSLMLTGIFLSLTIRARSVHACQAATLLWFCDAHTLHKLPWHAMHHWSKMLWFTDYFNVITILSVIARAFKIDIYHSLPMSFPGYSDLQRLVQDWPGSSLPDQDGCAGTEAHRDRHSQQGICCENTG